MRYDKAKSNTPAPGVKLPKHLRPTVRRRKVGSEFKRLREAAGVTMDQAAERIGGDKSKISRQENGRQGISKLEVEALFELYGVDDQRLRTALIAMARESRRKGWWAHYADVVGEPFLEQLSVESDAARMCVYQPMLIPGLLQTPDYAETCIRESEKGKGRTTPEEQIKAWVDLRLERQEVLRREDGPTYLCLLDEAALHRRIGSPEVMAAQLQKLLDVNNPPQLSIQIVPLSQGWHAGLDGGFSIFSYPDPMDLVVVRIGYMGGAVYLEGDEAVQRHLSVFDQLRSSALSSHQSMSLIARMRRELDES